MRYSRRGALGIGAGVAVLAIMPFRANAATDDVIEAFTSGADLSDGGIDLTTPEIAENGNTVPISFDAPGAQEVIILAAGNPMPGVATFKFGEKAGSQSASTRVRLAGTQDIIAVAKMKDGSFVKATNNVKVTIGGCGG